MLAVVIRDPVERDCVLGDLEEEFHEVEVEGGPRVARRWYRGTVLRVFVRYSLERAVARLGGRRSGMERKRRRMVGLGALHRDVRYAVRRWLRAPVFTLTAALTVALGVGATTAIFSVADFVLLETPKGVRDPESLVSMQALDTSTGRTTRLSYPLFEAYRRGDTGLEDLAAFEMFPATVSGNSDAEPEVVGGMLVSAAYFPALRTRPHLGRFFLPEEDSTRGAHAVVVLSYRYWSTRLGADSTVLGRTVRVNRTPFTVIGIAEEGFRGHVTGYDFSLWVPMAMAGAVTDIDLDAWGYHAFNVLARLAPGRSVAEVAAATRLVVARVRARHPRELENLTLLVQPNETMIEEFKGPVVAFMALLFGLSAVVLLIAGVNVGAMLLSSAAARSHEIGVRLAIGSGRGRLIRQLLTESVLLFLLGSGLGAGLAWWGTGLLSAATLPTPVPLVLDITPDLRVLAFTVTVAFVTGILFGLAPALHATRPDTAGAIRGEIVRRSGRRLPIRDVFVVAQVAGSVLLLVIAGLFWRGVERAGTVDVGFDPQTLHVIGVDLSLSRYGTDEAAAFFRRLRERTEATPGIAEAAFARTIPMGSSWQSSSFVVPGRDDAEFSADLDEVTPNWFSTMGIRLVAGRSFAEAGQTGVRETVVNETAARRFWPGASVLGERLRLGDEELVVVGVAADGKYHSIGEAPRSMVYVPMGERYGKALTMVVRTRPGAAGTGPALRELVRDLDPYLPVVANHSYVELIGLSVLPTVAALAVAGAFGLLGLLLAATGLFGVLSFAVSRRARELGIRIALGAAPATVKRDVLVDGLRLTGIGLLVGCPLAFAAALLLPSLLYGLSPADPLTYAGIAALLGGVGALASHVPARRATRVDPVTALRGG
jgi:predicted permease